MEVGEKDGRIWECGALLLYEAEHGCWSCPSRVNWLNITTTITTLQSTYLPSPSAKENHSIGARNSGEVVAPHYFPSDDDDDTDA